MNGLNAVAMLVEENVVAIRRPRTMVLIYKSGLREHGLAIFRDDLKSEDWQVAYVCEECDGAGETRIDSCNPYSGRVCRTCRGEGEIWEG